MYNHNIPTIKEKVRHMPHVYYFNLDHETDRKEYMESQLDHYGINYTRVSQSNYLSRDYDSWKHKLDNPDLFDVSEVYEIGSLNPINHVASFLTHLELFYKWYHNTNENYLIVMEDDYDLSLIEKWHFTWECLMNRIPYDWDALQFSFETPIGNFYPMFLHPKPVGDVGFGAMMLNRSYIKKLLKISHTSEGKLMSFFNKGLNEEFLNHQGILNSSTCSIDTCISGPGVTYKIPLITMNYDLLRKEQLTLNPEHHQLYCEYIVKNWWKTERDNFSVDDFFTYGKPYDHLMGKTVNSSNAFL